MRVAARPTWRSLPVLALGVGSRREAAEHAVERLRHAGQPGPVVGGEDRDASQEREDGRQPDPCPDALGARSGRTEQMADPSGEHLQLLLADARPLGDRIGLGPWRDRRRGSTPDRGPGRAGPPCVAGGLRSPHRPATTPSSSWSAPRRASTASGEDVALGGAVAIGHRQRGQLVPEQEEPAERCEEARVQPAGLPSRRRSAPTSAGG